MAKNHVFSQVVNTRRGLKIGYNVYFTSRFVVFISQVITTQSQHHKPKITTLKILTST
jgi:hypothetical protein